VIGRQSLYHVLIVAAISASGSWAFAQDAAADKAKVLLAQGIADYKALNFQEAQAALLKVSDILKDNKSALADAQKQQLEDYLAQVPNRGTVLGGRRTRRRDPGLRPGRYQRVPHRVHATRRTGPIGPGAETQGSGLRRHSRPGPSACARPGARRSCARASPGTRRGCACTRPGTRRGCARAHPGTRRGCACTRPGTRRGCARASPGSGTRRGCARASPGSGARRSCARARPGSGTRRSCARASPGSGTRRSCACARPVRGSRR